MVRSLNSVRAGDPAGPAIARLFEQHGARMYSLALRLCRGPRDAEDLVQEIFLRAFRRWETFDGRANPTTWLYTIAVRTCQRMHRRRAGQPQRMHSLDELRTPVIAQQSREPAERGRIEPGDRESVERAQAAIAALPATFRMPFILKEIAGLSLADVAGALGVKEATVKTRLHRARLRIREAVAAPPGAALPHSGHTAQICLDLLAAKQEALDRGASFGVAPGVICEHCRSVLASLDLAHDVCAALARGELPAGLRERVMARVAG